MTATLLKNTTKISQQSILKLNNNRLVARWLLDENLQLYCQWQKQNCSDRNLQKFDDFIHYD